MGGMLRAVRMRPSEVLVHCEACDHPHTMPKKQFKRMRTPYMCLRCRRKKMWADGVYDGGRPSRSMERPKRTKQEKGNGR